MKYQINKIWSKKEINQLDLNDFLISISPYLKPIVLHYCLYTQDEGFQLAYMATLEALTKYKPSKKIQLKQWISLVVTNKLISTVKFFKQGHGRFNKNLASLDYLIRDGSGKTLITNIPIKSPSPWNNLYKEDYINCMRSIIKDYKLTHIGTEKKAMNALRDYYILEKPISYMIKKYTKKHYDNAIQTFRRYILSLIKEGDITTTQHVMNKEHRIKIDHKIHSYRCSERRSILCNYQPSFKWRIV